MPVERKSPKYPFSLTLLTMLVTTGIPYLLGGDQEPLSFKQRWWWWWLSFFLGQFLLVSLFFGPIRKPIIDLAVMGLFSHLSTKKQKCFPETVLNRTRKANHLLRLLTIKRKTPTTLSLSLSLSQSTFLLLSWGLVNAKGIRV